MAEAKTISNLPTEAHTRFAIDEILTQTNPELRNSESISWSALAASTSSTSPAEQTAFEKLIDVRSRTSKWAMFDPPDGFIGFVKVFLQQCLIPSIGSSEEIKKIEEQIRDFKTKKPEEKDKIEKLLALTGKLDNITELLAWITAKCNEYQKG